MKPNPRMHNPFSIHPPKPKPSSIMFAGIGWSAWSGVPAHLKTADGTRLSPEGIGRIASGIGPTCGGAAAGNWHWNFNPFVVPFDLSCIENNALGFALNDNQRHILVTHGYDKGFLATRPAAVDKLIIRPSSDWAAPPPGFVDLDDVPSDDDDDDGMADDDKYGTFHETDAAGVHQTYHRCSGDETMTYLATMYDIEINDLVECNKDDFSGLKSDTLLPRGSEVWVSIYV